MEDKSIASGPDRWDFCCEMCDGERREGDDHCNVKIVFLAFRCETLQWQGRTEEEVAMRAHSRGMIARCVCLFQNRDLADEEG